MKNHRDKYCNFTEEIISHNLDKVDMREHCSDITYHNNMGITTVGLTGESGEKMNDICNFTIRVPSLNTARIQEAHILVGHILCQIIEEELFPQN